MEQQRLVERRIEAPLDTVRDRTIALFRTHDVAVPPPFAGMSVVELASVSPDWLVTFVDEGHFLDGYLALTAQDRRRDLLIEEFTGDAYWMSEYVSAGRPARFRTGFIVHFAEEGPRAARLSVFEKVPEVWVGERLAFAMHGIGFGPVHDIRFVEPTVADRVALLDLIQTAVH